jgi:YidC/Oxa1 family membrane protein insertase
MISSVWNTVVYDPLHNLLIFLVSIMPGSDVGLAIIVLTILVKLAMYPLSGKAIIAQQAMKALEPEIKLLQDKYKDDKQALAQKTMELYQKHKVTPFSGCLPLLVQMPIIIALYWIFWKGLSINPEELYSFTPRPDQLDFQFFMFDLTAKSVVLAALAGMTQYFQTDYSLGKSTPPEPSKDGKPSFKDDFTRSMQVQMRYVFPVMISFFAYSLPAAVALYWTVSNILGIGQEYLMRRSGLKKDN